MSEPEVLARVEGVLGHLTLNRPRSLNALSAGMIASLTTHLDEWSHDPAVEVVLIDGAGDRGLCAGGDVKQLYSGLTGRSPLSSFPARQFWATEYAMNSAVARFPKPYVALMDGICFGGGLGVSVHGSVRVVTERTQLAMPETAIGLAPDVGALYWLARMPGGTGTYAALTGARLNAGDALDGGLADVYCPTTQLASLIGAAQRGEPPRPGLQAGASTTPSLRSDRPWIDECFSQPTIDAIAGSLATRPEPPAKRALLTLRAMSPTAVKVTLAAIRRAATLPTVDDVLAQDLLVSTAFTRHPDLAEGIRALLIEKDRQPRWTPARWEDVSDDDVARFFVP